MANKNNLIFIAGPCVIEDKVKTLDIAQALVQIIKKHDVDFIFKASYDKANRTSISSYRGPGLKKGLKILEQIKSKLDLKILSDVHDVSEVDSAAKVLDIIQIPAFLCRQTDLIIKASRTKKIINIKKGQFVSPSDVKHIVDKVLSTGNKRIYLTERGVCFGYNNLVVDFRSFGILSAMGFPVIFDATHSVQRPSAGSGSSLGDVNFVPGLCRAAVAFGVNGLFLEVHPDPKKALSDKTTSFKLDKVDRLISSLLSIKRASSIYGK